MYSLTSLQMIQTHAKLSNTSALMIVYTGANNPNIKQDQIENSLKLKGFWYWLKENNTPELFAAMRVQACLHNELYLFDVNIDKDLLARDKNSNWNITMFNPDGTIRS